MAELKNIVNAKKYKVQDGDSIKSIADKAGISWQELAKFNWGTDDPDKINQFLRIKVGCLNKSKDGKNYVFSSKDDPGIVYLPEELPKKTYSTSATHVVKVKLPEVKIFIPGECYVSFRPKPDWTGDVYGFDWMRIGDFPISVAPDIGENYKYKDIVGKHYVKPNYLTKLFSPKTSLVVQGDPNSYQGEFKTDAALFGKLEVEYEKKEINFKDGSSVQNFTSYLSIYMTEKDEPETVVIQAYSFIKQPPEELIFKYDKKYFEITPAKLSQLGVNYGGAPHKERITIKCLSTFDSDQSIQAISVFRNTGGGYEEKIVGKLKVVANSKPNRKIKKVLLINVKTPSIKRGGVQRTGNARGNLDFIQQSLRQALIDPVFDPKDPITLDISLEKDFSGYIRGNGIIAYKLNDPGYTKLDQYCYAKLKQRLKAADPASENKYDGTNYLKAFYFGEEIGRIGPDGSAAALNGYSSTTHEFVVMSGTAIESTAAHEFLHALTLPHSFDGISPQSTYTYQGKNTENILDYTHHRDGDYNFSRVSLWHWQWKIANGNADPEP